MALCTLGSIASPDMARDLAPEVEKLIKSPSPLIKKKAALCAVRLLRKDPELVETFMPATRSLVRPPTKKISQSRAIAGLAGLDPRLRLIARHYRRFVLTLTIPRFLH